MGLHCLMTFLPLAAFTPSWVEGPAMPHPSGGHAAAFMDGQLYVIGGTNWRDGRKYWLDDIIACVPSDGAWSAVGRLPMPIGYGAWASTSDRLYLCGGADGAASLKTCMALSPYDGALRTIAMAPLPAPRVYAGAALCGDTLYVVAGSPDHADLSSPADTLFGLDLAGPRLGWITRAPLPLARTLPAVAAVDERLYLFGGCRLDAEGNATNLGDAWVYDQADDAWQPLPDMPKPSRGTDAVAVSDREILLVGGYTATAEQAERYGPAFGFSDEVWVFDSVTGEYHLASRLPYSAVTTAPVFDGEHVYLTGGEDRMRSRSNRLTIGSG